MFPFGKTDVTRIKSFNIPPEELVQNGQRSMLRHTGDVKKNIKKQNNKGTHSGLYYKKKWSPYDMRS